MLDDSWWGREQHYLCILKPYSIFWLHIEHHKPKQTRSKMSKKLKKSRNLAWSFFIVKLEHTLGMRSSIAHAIRMWKIKRIDQRTTRSLLVFSWTCEPLVKESGPSIFWFGNIWRTGTGGSLNFQRATATQDWTFQLNNQ
jgi:hypothetical protein